MIKLVKERINKAFRKGPAFIVKFLVAVVLIVMLYSALQPKSKWSASGKVICEAAGSAPWICTLGFMRQIESLNLRGCKLNEIEVLQEFTNLRQLDLSFNAISDFRPLVECTRLQQLDLSEAYAERPILFAHAIEVQPPNLGVLRLLPELSVLKLRNIHGGVLAADLVGLSRLESLDLRGTKLLSSFGVQPTGMSDVCLALPHLRELIVDEHVVGGFYPAADSFPLLERLSVHLTYSSESIGKFPNGKALEFMEEGNFVELTLLGRGEVSVDLRTVNCLRRVRIERGVKIRSIELGAELTENSNTLFISAESIVTPDKFWCDSNFDRIVLGDVSVRDLSALASYIKRAHGVESVSIHLVDRDYELEKVFVEDLRVQGIDVRLHLTPWAVEG